MTRHARRRGRDTPTATRPEPTPVVSSTAIPAAGTEPPIERPRQPRDATWHPASHLEDDVLRKPGAVLLAAPVALGELRRRRSSRGAACSASAASPPSRRRRAPHRRRARLPPATRDPREHARARLRRPVRRRSAPRTIRRPRSPSTFDRPMDHHSVAAALRVDPPTAYRSSWDRRTRRATLRPAGHWRADTLYQVVRRHGRARSVDGGSLAAPCAASSSPAPAAPRRSPPR